MSEEQLKYTVRRLIPSGTEFTHYDPADRCIVSPTGWRLPVFATMRGGGSVLEFMVDPSRDAVKRPDLCIAEDDS